MFAALAEFERGLIIERTRAGMKAARARGVRPGPKPKLSRQQIEHARKLIEDGQRRDSDEIVGFTAFGIEASELLAAVQTAMVGRLPYTVLRDTIFAHPTMSEGLVFLLEQSRKP
jgi:pyruvate/2-oxoglutarate dehydrogenase complex dihydrolipoamide dehydrogenase (E3) component